MNQNELFEFHQRMGEKALAICKKKNNDYTSAARGGSYPFANFSRVEAMGIMTTVPGFLGRMTDKLSRLSTYADLGRLEVGDETVEDTLLDMINYSILLAAYMRHCDGGK